MKKETIKDMFDDGDIGPDKTIDGNIVTYDTAGVWLAAGFYKLAELKGHVANIERWNAALVASMKETQK